MKKVISNLAGGLVLAASILTFGCQHSDKSSEHTPDNVIPARGTDYSAAKTGDIVLADGTLCSAEDFNKETMTAVAVIYHEATLSDDAIGIALKESTAHTPWCLKTAAGYKAIPALYSVKNSLTAYELLASACASDITEAGNYPAWEYCAKYGIENSYEEPFLIGWCLPSTKEIAYLNDNNIYTKVSSSITKAGGIYLKYNSSVKTGVDPSSRQDLTTTTWYVTCNQNGNDAFLHNLGSELQGDKVTGRTGFTSPYVTIKMIARPVYHFINDRNTLALPFFSEKTDGKITITAKEQDVTVCYKIDDGEWTEKASPATVTLDSSAHTVTAYTKKEGLEVSEPLSKDYEQDPIY